MRYRSKGTSSRTTSGVYRFTRESTSMMALASEALGDDLIKLWKFDKAPAKYKSLHEANFTPEWIAVMQDDDAEEFDAFLGKASRGPSERHVLPDGTLVYIGS